MQIALYLKDSVSSYFKWKYLAKIIFKVLSNSIII